MPARNWGTLDRDFDVVFSNACIQWIPNHPKLLREMMQLLRPGGILIFEHSKKMDFSDLDEFWQLRSYGSVQFSFFKKP